MAEDIYLQMQKLANATQVKLQKMSNEATAKSFKYNSDEAKASRSWQEQMSNTAHQREVKDLKKAGLNPVLSANSGAQSYTTSSASAEAENPSSGMAQLASSEMSGMAGIKQSEISAAATKNAAATTAAAQRAAAAQAAAAQKYAADVAYRTAQERNETELKKVEAQGQWNYKIQTEKPVSSLPGLLDKLMNRQGLYGVIDKYPLAKTYETVRSFFANPKAFFTTEGRNLRPITEDNYRLTSLGKVNVDQRLRSMNLTASNYTRNLFVKGFVFQNESAILSILNIAKANRNRRYRGPQQ